MNRSAQKAARKCPVNLTLSEDLVAEVKTVTGNLPDMVESLLTEFVCKERARRSGVVDNALATAVLWNAFGDRQRSFADGHLTL